MKVTVLIPTLNPKREYLQQALLSVPVNVDEIVLAGQGFNLKDYDLPKGPEVFIFNTSLGLADTINKAVQEYIIGDYFSILPDDDFYLEGIEHIVERVKDSAADVVHFEMIHYRGNERLPGVFCNDPEMTYEKNYEQNTVNGSAFIKRSSFLWLEGYKVDLCGDWDFFNRALKSKMYFEHLSIRGIALRFNGHSRLQRLAASGGSEKIKKEAQRISDEWNKQIYARCAGWAGC